MKPICFLVLIIVGWFMVEWATINKEVSVLVLGLETMGVFLTTLSLKAKKQLDREGSLIKATEHQDSEDKNQWVSKHRT